MELKSELVNGSGLLDLLGQICSFKLSILSIGSSGKSLSLFLMSLLVSLLLGIGSNLLSSDSLIFSLLESSGLSLLCSSSISSGLSLSSLGFSLDLGKFGSFLSLLNLLLLSELKG